MFDLFKPKLPVSDEQKQWIDKSFLRLAILLKTAGQPKNAIMLPTPEHFPDPYDGSEEALQKMFRRVASRMDVNADEIEVMLFVSHDRITRKLVPFYSGSSSGAAGLYHHDPNAPAQISVDEGLLKDPAGLVAVLAHELGHIILLRPGLISREEPDMEPLTDLLTVFLGFGVFTANAAFQFRQYSNYDAQGWSARRLGYLSEEQFGYALARFAFERGETKPKWISFLSTNVAGYMKRSLAWLSDRSEPRLFATK